MNRMSRTRRGLYAAASLGVLAGVGACSKAPARPPRPAIAVSVIPVKRTSVPYDIEANGIVTPMQTANVAPQVDGIIVDVDFSEGQEVTKGQVLFHLDPRPYQATYDQVAATLARDKATAAYAQSEFERYDALVKQGIVTREQADQLRANAQSAAATVQADQATLAAAKFNLDNCIVRAPISGRTGSLLVRTGNLVHAAGATPLVVINQVRPILVRFAVPATNLPQILHYGEQNGRPIALPVTAVPATGNAPGPAADTSASMDAGGGKAAGRQAVAIAKTDADGDSKGGLSMIDNAVDTTTATVMLKASFPNRGGTLWPGQFVGTTLRLFVEDSVLVLPTQAVVTGQQGTYVYVIDSSNTAQQRMVTVERTAAQLSVIASGVSEGERVVTDGQSRVTPGAQVTIGSREPSAGDPASGGRGGRGGQGPRRAGRTRQGGRSGLDHGQAAVRVTVSS